MIFLVVVVLPLSHVRLIVTPWTAARQAFLSTTITQSLLKFMSIELVMMSLSLMSLPVLYTLVFFRLTRGACQKADS